MRIIRILTTPLIALAFAACSESNCILGNTIEARVEFRSSVSGKQIASSGMTTLWLCRQNAADTVVINKRTNMSKFSLPLDNTSEQDIFILQYDTAYNSPSDTFTIGHTNIPKFVSIECGTEMYHTITYTSSTDNVMDSLVVVRKDVNYYEEANIYIYCTDN